MYSRPDSTTRLIIWRFGVWVAIEYGLTTFTTRPAETITVAILTYPPSIFDMDTADTWAWFSLFVGNSHQDLSFN